MIKFEDGKWVLYNEDETKILRTADSKPEIIEAEKQLNRGSRTEAPRRSVTTRKAKNDIMRRRRKNR